MVDQDGGASQASSTYSGRVLSGTILSIGTFCLLVDVSHQSWSELNRERLTRPQNGITNGDTRGLLVNLDCRLVVVDSNDLCKDEMVGPSRSDNPFAAYGLDKTVNMKLEQTGQGYTPPTSSSCPTRTCVTEEERVGTNGPLAWSVSSLSLI